MSVNDRQAGSLADRCQSDDLLYLEQLYPLGLEQTHGHRAIRQLAVSEKITKETEQKADAMFPELHDLCHRAVLPVFMSDEYRAFGDALFLTLAETTMEFATREPARASEFISLGFEAMWRALTREES